MCAHVPDDVVLGDCAVGAQRALEILLASVQALVAEHAVCVTRLVGALRTLEALRGRVLAEVVRFDCPLVHTRKAAPFERAAD